MTRLLNWARFVAIVWMGVCASVVMAQSRTPYSYTSDGVQSKYVTQQVVDVDDFSGHQIRVYENVRYFPEGTRPVFDGEQVVEIRGRGFSNFVNGVGPSWGYTTFITDKGNRIFGEYSGAVESSLSESGSRRGTYRGMAKPTGGTGKFGHLRGQHTEVTDFDNDPKTGYVRGVAKGEYWFEK